MDLKVEHHEDHTAELIVEVDDDSLNSARRKAAKRLAKELRIPGFRPGKAPYNVILGYVGEAGLTQEAIEDLSNDIYRQALEESEVDPYAPGEITDIDTEDGVTLTFVVPKQPVVELGNYREDLRLEYEVDEVTDKDVEKSLARTRENLVLTEYVNRPAAMGDQVIINVRGVFVKDEDDEEDEAKDTVENAVEAEDDAEANLDDNDAEEEDSEEVYIDQEEMSYILLDDPDRDLAPGFSEEIVDITAGEVIEFSLTFADDEEDADLAGRMVHFTVEATEVNAVIMPDEDDFLADLASDGELKTLDELNEKLRSQLTEIFENRASEVYADKVLEQLVEMADVAYPEAAIEHYLDDVIEELDSYFKNQTGLQLSDYLRVTGGEMDEIRQQNRPRAVTRLQNSLVLSKLVEIEKVTVDSDAIQAEIQRQAETFGGEQAEIFLEILNSDEHIERTALNLLTQETIKRMTDIAKGLNPPLPAEDSDNGDDTDEPETAEDASDTEAAVAGEVAVEDETDTASEE